MSTYISHGGKKLPTMNRQVVGGKRLDRVITDLALRHNESTDYLRRQTELLLPTTGGAVLFKDHKGTYRLKIYGYDQQNQSREILDYFDKLESFEKIGGG